MITKFLDLVGKKPLLMLLALVITAGVGRIAWLQLQLRSAQQATADAELALENTRASRDSIRQDGNTWSRLAFQRQLELDSLDRLLQVESRARLTLEARIAALDTSLVSDVTVVEDDSVRLASVTAYREPYSVSLAVSVPRPPREARWDVGIRLDPAQLQVRLACNGRAARTAVSAPPWLTIDSLTVVQEPDVCVPPVQATSGGRSFLEDLALGCAIGAGVGLVSEARLQTAGLVGCAASLGLRLVFE